MRASLLLPLIALAACGRSADEGATVTLNSDDGQVRAAFGGDGNGGAVKLDLPGFKGEFKLPKVKLDAANFDLNGVHLYPGSAIESVDVNGSNSKGKVRVGFSSPAGPDAVRDWYAGRLRGAGFTLRQEGAALVGTDDDGKPFRMDLAADGADRARGTIVMGD